MRHMSRCLCLPALFAAALSQGATPYEGDLPIELARYFTGGGFWYSDLPDGLPSFTLPAGVQVMGSLDQGQRKQVILTTSMESAMAQEALIEAFLTEDGWVKEPTLSEETLQPRGFVSEGQAPATPTSLPLRLCHDRHGSVQIDSRFAANVIYMSFGGAPRRGTPSCLQSRQFEQRIMARNTSTLSKYMPVIELPAGSGTRGNRPLNDSNGTSENEIETGVRLSAEDQSLRGLNRNFSRQMRRQGWKRDEQWAGDLSAGSSWTLQTDDDRELSALLSLVHVTETDYVLRLRLQELL